jgi:hypothetical protein
MVKKKVKPVKKAPITKTVMVDIKVEPPIILPKDEKKENLKKLSDSSIVVNFVEDNKGCWNHQTWTDFCGTLAKEGFTPIDFEQVGVLLEIQKASYIAAGR